MHHEKSFKTNKLFSISMTFTLKHQGNPTKINIICCLMNSDW